VVSKSFEKFTTSLHHNFSTMEAKDWLYHLRCILIASNKTVNLIEKSIPVLIHCSDGWDRTSQVSAISQILLDPFYRTMEGFSTLIEKDWISFGFKFQDRNDHLKKNTSERSPVFYQFIHCVLLIWMQSPKSFEFNQQFLLFILEQSYSCLFGNFLYNNQKESKEWKQKTYSIWNFIELSKHYFMNPLYTESKSVLTVDCENLSTDFFFICQIQYGDEKSIYLETIFQEITDLIKENEYLKLLKENNTKEIKNEKLEEMFLVEQVVTISKNLNEEIKVEPKYLPDLTMSFIGGSFGN
jgi:hypothetical protein